MTKELDEKLCKDYPKIFADRHADMRTTAMCWGFDCGDGWYWLIDRLCHNLQWDTDHNKAPQVIASQVKEKYGGLRFYTQGASLEQNAVIDFAEALSYSICENCGSTKDVTQNAEGWVYTLCKTCRNDK